MNFLFDHLREILDRVGASKKIFFFLDYDGTLTDIVPHPDDARLSEEMKTTLTLLKRSPKVSLAIVSGRSLRDIRNRVGLKGIYYVGNHGMEVFEPQSGVRQLFPKRVARGLEVISDRLNFEFRGIEGIFVENKKWTLSIHYRNVDPRWAPSIQMKLHQEIKGSIIPLHLCRGKKVFEIRPQSEVDKGTAVLSLLGKEKKGGILPIYIGDDRTDEDAFRSLKRKGITVLVSRPRPVASSAQYYARDPSEVHHFLERIRSSLFRIS
jgi:trehalose-phosphatase